MRRCCKSQSDIHLICFNICFNWVLQKWNIPADELFVSATEFDNVVKYMPTKVIRSFKIRHRGSMHTNNQKELQIERAWQGTI